MLHLVSHQEEDAHTAMHVQHGNCGQKARLRPKEKVCTDRAEAAENAWAEE